MNSPSFQFYPADWLIDEKVMTMSMAGEGCYIRLLSHCWREGSIPADRPAIVALCKGYDGPGIDEALTCFVHLKKNGRLINPRADRERRKQESFRKLKKEAGLRGANKRWHSHGRPIVLPMAKNDSSSSSSSSTSVIKEDKNLPFFPLAEFLKERIQVNVPFQKIPANYRESWSNDFRLMVSPKLSIERIQEVLDWATTDEFWKVNIRSAAKFREKFGALEAKSRSASGPDQRQSDIQRDRQVGKSTALDAGRQKKIDAIAERIYGKEFGPKLESAQGKEEYRKYKAEADEAFRIETGKIMRGEPK